MRRKNRTKDVPWDGPDIGDHEKATCHSIPDNLKADYLAESKEDQGRDALDEIIGIALRLGIEQGRRIFRQSPEYQMLKLLPPNFQPKE